MAGGWGASWGGSWASHWGVVTGSPTTGPDAWRGSWGQSWGNSWTRTSGGGTTPVNTDVGSAGRRRPHREFVEIDGQYFPVESQEQAIEILQQLQQTAKEAAAKQAVKDVQRAPAKAVAPAVPQTEIKASPDLLRALGIDLQAEQQRLAQTYEREYYAQMARALEDQEVAEAITALDAYEAQVIAVYLGTKH